MTKQQVKTEKLGINTRLAHDGYQPRDYHGFVNPPVVRASTVLFPDAETMATGGQKYTYGTRGTPTSDALCAAINALEGSAGTICVPSGLAAVTVPLLAFLSPGDHALFVDSIYNPTRHFADTILKRLGVDVEYYDPEIGSGIAKLMRANTKVVFTGSPASNTFEMQDIPAIVEEAHKGGAIVMMDNTWATALYFKALDFGVDISIHASTKYPSGHSDILFGTVSANENAGRSFWKRTERSVFALRLTTPTRYCAACAPWACGWNSTARTRWKSRAGLKAIRRLTACCIQRWKAIPAMKSGNGTFPAPPAFSPSCLPAAGRRKPMPSSMRWRFSALAIPGAAMKASRFMSASMTGPSPGATIRDR